MLILLLAALFAVVGSVAWANTSSTTETKDLKSYGNCHTVNYVDLFTDAENYGLLCRESDFTDESLIGIFTKSGRLYIVIGKGLQFHLDDAVPVMIRIDKDGIIRHTARWNRQSPTQAYIEDDALARQLLHDLARGQRVIIKVGDEGGNIRLNGSRRAIQDFRQRAGLQPQQTLTLPRHRR